MKKGWPGILWTVLGLTLVCAMPSGHSLWLDEGYTEPYARDGAVSGFVDRILADQGSEALRPLGMFSFWAGAKVFGTSELGLRLVSALWTAVAVILLGRTGRIIGCPWLPALFAVHPFVWYYTGEARPYAMLIAMGAGILYGLAAVWAGEATTDRGLAALSIFGPLASATDVLGILLFGPAAAIVAGILVHRGWRPRLRQWLAFALSAGALVLLGVYYVATLSRGVDTGWEGVWRVGGGNLVFAAYEHLGFAGFGPGRNELRQAMLGGDLKAVIGTFFRPSAVGLVFLAALYLSLLLRLGRQLGAGPWIAHSLLLAAGAVITVTTAAIFVVSVVVRFSFWGRHLAPLCAFVVLAVALAARGPRQTRSLPEALILCLAIAWLASSLLLRFHDSHSRDDYRSAAIIARTAAASGETVWWVASRHCGEYYGVRFCDPVSVAVDDPVLVAADDPVLVAADDPVLVTADDPVLVAAGDPPPGRQGRCVLRLESPGAEDLEGVPKPDLIVISRPEFYDHREAVRSHIAIHGLTVVERPTAFQVLRAVAPGVTPDVG